jgi:hypothetical protein
MKTNDIVITDSDGNKLDVDEFINRGNPIVGYQIKDKNDVPDLKNTEYGVMYDREKAMEIYFDKGVFVYGQQYVDTYRVVPIHKDYADKNNLRLITY